MEISGQLNARIKGCGNAKPDVSITIWSGLFSRSNSDLIVGIKSSATVQQMQPFDSSMISSSVHVSSPQPFNISPSTPKSPNSLIISAIRLP